MLSKKNYHLYYFKHDNQHEIEFLIEKERKVIPIEVKAGNTATPSLNTFIDSYNPSIAYKMIDGNLGVVEVKKTLPHYMIIFL